ncbi:hypothetical protein EYF80_061372 [Liparis tanakae]|uniref:Uncharacterized protein n=1 Tax=Liparis tanakae TaxID=230148 RepID=A0A4Z2EI60_9TELE|nr:hypothetical protein EYF80_061372 [Liparis tanakae]
MVRVHYGSLLRWEVPVSLHVLLQGAVALLAPGEGVVGRDLLPRLVAGEGERLGLLVLEEALQVPLGQLRGVVHGEAVEGRLLLLHVALPEEQFHHKVLAQPADGALVEGPVEQRHAEPHDGRHAGAGEDADQRPQAAEAVPPRAQLGGVEAAAGVEPPQAGAEEQAQDQQHRRRAQQEGHPVGEVLLAVAGALEGDHGEDPLAADRQQSHEAVADGGFLVHEEAQDGLEVVHGAGGGASSRSGGEIERRGRRRRARGKRLSEWSASL